MKKKTHPWIHAGTASASITQKQQLNNATGCNSKRGKHNCPLGASAATEDSPPREAGRQPGIPTDSASIHALTPPHTHTYNSGGDWNLLSWELGVRRSRGTETVCKAAEGRRHRGRASEPGLLGMERSLLPQPCMHRPHREDTMLLA